MGSPKKESNTEAIYASLGLVGMGMVFSVVGPPLAAIGLWGMGGASTVYFIADSLYRAKERDIFRKCGLTVDDIPPHIIKKKKADLYVKIPVGLSFDSFKNKQNTLEVAFNCKLELTQESYNVLHIHLQPDVPFS